MYNAKKVFLIRKIDLFLYFQLKYKISSSASPSSNTGQINEYKIVYTGQNNIIFVSIFETPPPPLPPVP